jgi:hypothetical protein
MAMSIVCETGASRLTVTAVVAAIAGCILTIGTVCGSGAEHAAKTSNVVAPQYAIFLMPYHTVPCELC